MRHNSDLENAVNAEIERENLTPRRKDAKVQHRKPKQLARAH
jgi:hypothetical protein